MISASTAFWMRHLKNDVVCGDILRTCVPLLPDVGLLSEIADLHAGENGGGRGATF
jgi:hypothetical protein